MATNSSGKDYYESHGEDTHGNPGMWHIYQDSKGNVTKKIFIADPTPPAWNAGGNSMATSAAAALAPAPAPEAPHNDSNGGVLAPDSAAPAAPAQDVAPPTSPESGPQKPNNDHQWVYNDNKKMWYYDELRGSDQTHDGSAGFVHVYENGDRVYVAKTQPSAIGGGATNSIETSAAIALQNSASTQQSDHDTATVTDTASTIGNIANADGSHGALGFSGQASAAPAPATAPAATPATVSINGAGSPFDPASATPVATAQPVDQTGGNASVSANSYSVVAGDNMWDIAQAHNMSLDQLKALNPQIEHAELILPGQQINLGGAVAAGTDDGASFPTTSTYQTSSHASQANDANVHKIGGWSDGTSGVPADPINAVIGTGGPIQTDPMKIDDNKHQS